MDPVVIFPESMATASIFATSPFSLCKLAIMISLKIMFIAIHTWIDLLVVTINFHLNMFRKAMVCFTGLVLFPVRGLTALPREKMLEDHLLQMRIELDNLIWERKELHGQFQTSVREIRILGSMLAEVEEENDKAIAKIESLEVEVLSEYPEAKMTTTEQEETYQELVKKLDEALHNFEEGPPFTLQRLCEILLAARHIYPNLSKLALALEKNLLVTSTLAVCTDPYPQTLEKPGETDKPSEELQVQSSLVQNGVEPVVVGDGDEIMTEVEEADIDDDMTIDMEALEEIVASSETNSTSTGNS